MKKKLELRWVRGWDCGWTSYGLCFSPDWREDIHDNFIIPFKDLELSVVVDEPARPDEFGFNSVVLARFSEKRNTIWEAIVYQYWSGYNYKYRKRMPYKIFVTTDFEDLDVQLKDDFHPNSVRLKGTR